MKFVRKEKEMLHFEWTAKSDDSFSFVAAPAARSVESLETFAGRASSCEPVFHDEQLRGFPTVSKKCAFFVYFHRIMLCQVLSFLQFFMARRS